MLFLSGLPNGFRLDDEKRSTWVTLTRTGEWKHGIYGKFEITLAMLQRMIENFEANTLGQKIFIDIGHRPDDGAAGEIVELSIEGNRLRGRVEWTDFGIKQVTEKGFRYMSVDFIDDYEDPETGEFHGPLLFGAALTTRPFVKRLDPVELTEPFAPPEARVLMHPQLRRQLSEHMETEMNKFLKKLRQKLEARKLSQGVIDQLVAAAEQAMKSLGEDEKALNSLVDKFDETGKTLADSIGDKEVKLSIDMPTANPGQGDGNGGDDAPKQLSEEQVAEIVTKKLADAEKKAAEQKRKLTESLDARKKILSDVIDEAEGLGDEQRKELTEQVEDLLTPDMPEDKVRKLAEYQVAQAHKLSAAHKLASLGYQDTRSGSPQISMDHAEGVRKLSESIRENLAKTSQHASGQLRLKKEEPVFCQMVLSEFDRQNAHRLEQEHRIMLADGDVDTSRTDLPVSFQREVIREALSDLRVLELVQTLTDFGATATTQIPYEVRDDVNAILNDGVVFEGQPIPSSGIQQKMDLAYILPMKLAMNLTNEVMHFTRQSGINWDGWGRNVASNARAMRELLARRIANELQRVADAFQASSVTDEDVSGQLDGTESIITLANFPVVRPFQTRDLKGNAVGSEENPITVSVDGTPASRWDGSGNQAAGTYWRPYNFNLGKIQLVDQAGTPVTPSATTATVSYSYATNVTKFDIKVPSGTALEKHLNGALRAIGSAKAILRADRFIEPNFQLMSPVLNDTVTNADQFAAQSRREGTDTDSQGDLETVKGVPVWGTNAPNVDLGDERIVMGVRGQLSYVQAKPFQTISQPFEAVDPTTGQPTGKKVAYGEEYSAIHVPVPLRGRMRSVLLFNSDDRA